MVNYSNGKIYKIASLNTNKIYIGGTTERLSVRMAKHRYSCKTYGSYTSKDVIKYGNAFIILIEKYPCTDRDELRAREQHWIDKFKNICVNHNAAYTGLSGPDYQHKYHQNEKWVNAKKEPKLCIYCDYHISSRHMARHYKSSNHKDAIKFAKKQFDEDDNTI